MNKRFIIILAVLFIGFLGIVVVSKKEKSSLQNGDTAGGSNHVFGNKESGVTLVEFGDFQCPACGTVFPIVSQLKADYGDSFAFQFRHYPIVNKHPNAMAAHRAAEAAAKQDRFWEMHDMLYARQKVWETSTNPVQIFEDYATELGLNVDKYKQDVASSTVNDIINADLKAAQAIGITGTPTFILNGRVLESSPATLDEFKSLIDAERQ